MPRPTTWVTELRHYIDEETEEWLEDMPGPALNLALALGSIVGWVTDRPRAGDAHRLTRCRISSSRTISPASLVLPSPTSSAMNKFTRGSSRALRSGSSW